MDITSFKFKVETMNFNLKASGLQKMKDFAVYLAKTRTWTSCSFVDYTAFAYYMDIKNRLN